MHKLLMLAAAGSVAAIGATTANAQDCVNGYRMVREIPMPCSGPAYSTVQPPVYVAPAPVYRPVYPSYGYGYPYGYGYGYGAPIITGSVTFGGYPRYRHYPYHDWRWSDRRHDGGGPCWINGRRGRC